MDLGGWLMLLAMLAVGAHGANTYLGDVRERRDVDDDTRRRERVALVLALDSLVGGSVRYLVSFTRLQRYLGWKTVQLSDVLAHCGQLGLVRIEGEPGLWSLRGTHAALTAEGASFAEWVRDGCPDDRARTTYTFNAPVTASNFAQGCTGDFQQVTGGGRIDVVECRRLVRTVREELRPGVLPAADLARARALLDDIEDALAGQPGHERLRSLASALRDVCYGAAGNGLWVALSALVTRLT